MKKLLAFTIMILFISVSVIPSTGTTDVKQITLPTAKGDTLYVGGNGTGNYSKIQDAIDDASNGDTVYVFDDSSPYYENVVVDKSINLIGENKETTIIWNILNTSGGTVRIISDNVNLCGFGITNSSCSRPGIEMSSTSNNSVYECIIYDNYGGILIQNSNNISLSNIDSTDSIRFNNLSNSHIKHCKIQNTTGIDIDESNKNTIENCSISNSNFGIYLGYSSNNHIIKNCKIFNNFDSGIQLDTSDFTVIENCNISDSRNGFMIWHSSYNTITDNILFNTGVYITWSENNNFSGNTVNKKPLMYLEGESNQVIEEAGQVILIGCNNITVQHQNLSNTTVGLTLWNSNNCQIKGNILTNNSGGGIRLDLSCDNIIVDNTIASNRLEGILLGRQSHNNIIYGNIVKDNDNGIDLWMCNNCQIYNNKIVENKHNGIHMSHGNDNNISMNKILNNTWHGIGLFFVSNSIISENTLLDNSWGGLDIFSSNHILIENNIIAESTNKSNGQGIILMNANNNTIFQNHIFENYVGITLTNSSYNYFSQNYIQNNLWIGIESRIISSNNTIIKNLIGNNLYGIYLNTNDNKIVNNNVIDNKIQAFFRGCKNTWDENYWNRMRFLPKPIFGRLGVQGFPALIPWVNFDWHPASEPYDIGV